LAEWRFVASGGLAARPRIVAVAGQAVRPERRLARDEQVVRLDGRALAQQPDDLADVGIFELDELEGLARGITHGRREVGRDHARLAALDRDCRGPRRHRHVDRLVAAWACGDARRGRDREAHDEDGFDLLETDLPDQALEARRSYRAHA